MAPKIIRNRRAMANLQNKLREAIDAGRSAQSRGNSEARFIQTLNSKKLTLQDHLGHATEAGKVYYGLLGIRVPKLYSYETPLINDQWVTGFSSRKVLVRGRLADGSWRMRKQGEAYFVANRDEVVVTVPTVLVMSLRDFSAGARARFDPVAH